MSSSGCLGVILVPVDASDLTVDLISVRSRGFWGQNPDYGFTCKTLEFIFIPG